MESVQKLETYHLVLILLKGQESALQSRCVKLILSLLTGYWVRQGKMGKERHWALGKAAGHPFIPRCWCVPPGQTSYCGLGEGDSQTVSRLVASTKETY